MKWKAKWLLAGFLTIVVFSMAKLENQGVIEQPVTPYVTSGKDFVILKKWLASLLEDQTEGDTITVSSIPQKDLQFSEYDSMQPYKDGVLASFANTTSIKAQGGGLVVFTGFTRQSGKTITVMYDDGDEVTYGFVETFSKLPYTAVKKGDTLGVMGENMMYLMVKRDGVLIDASLLPAYFAGEPYEN